MSLECALVSACWLRGGQDEVTNRWEIHCIFCDTDSFGNIKENIDNLKMW